MQLFLIVDRPRELVLLQELDQLVELDPDELFLALADGLAQQGGAAGIGGGGQLRHAEEDFFQVMVPVGQLLLRQR